jgi:hypothetical protein
MGRVCGSAAAVGVCETNHCPLQKSPKIHFLDCLRVWELGGTGGGVSANHKSVRQSPAPWFGDVQECVCHGSSPLQPQFMGPVQDMPVLRVKEAVAGLALLCM